MRSSGEIAGASLVLWERLEKPIIFRDSRMAMGCRHLAREASYLARVLGATDS